MELSEDLKEHFSEDSEVGFAHVDLASFGCLPGSARAHLILVLFVFQRLLMI